MAVALSPLPIVGCVTPPTPSEGLGPAWGRQRRDSMSSPQERAEQKRREKLDLIREQVDNGQLKIRKMTPAEREKNPPRPRPDKRGRR